MTTSYVPARGHAVWLRLTPHAGREQAGRRLAVVLSPISYNQRVGLAIFCPITSQRKGYPFEVMIPEHLAVTGVILADQIKSLDWRIRDVEYICQLPDATMRDVLLKVSTLLTINDS